MVSAESDMITLVSKEGDKFPVSVRIGQMSVMLGDLLEEGGDTTEDIPLSQVTSVELTKIIEYCTHFNFEKKETTIKAPLVSTVVSEFVTDPWEA